MPLLVILPRERLIAILAVEPNRASCRVIRTGGTPMPSGLGRLVNTLACRSIRSKASPIGDRAWRRGGFVNGYSDVELERVFSWNGGASFLGRSRGGTRLDRFFVEGATAA